MLSIPKTHILLKENLKNAMIVLGSIIVGEDVVLQLSI
jgi:hypothetical protein